MIVATCRPFPCGIEHVAFLCMLAVLLETYTGHTWAKQHRVNHPSQNILFPNTGLFMCVSYVLTCVCFYRNMSECDKGLEVM